MVVSSLSASMGHLLVKDGCCQNFKINPGTRSSSYVLNECPQDQQYHLVVYTKERE